MNTPVKYPLAKLLKEKGFDIPCREGWVNYLTLFTGKTGMPVNEYNLVIDRLGNMHLIERPTISDVVMWLYEKHGVWIRVTPIPYSENLTHWRWEHMSTNYTTRNVSWKKQKDYLSPTEAYEAAILYTLNNLI